METTVRENRRKTLVGTVVSTKNQKTITVVVEIYEKHPLYSKRFKKSKKFAVHDEQNLAKVGDIVKIQETRPLSKTKHFRLVEIKSHAIEGAENALVLKLVQLKKHQINLLLEEERKLNNGSFIKKSSLCWWSFNEKSFVYYWK